MFCNIFNNTFEFWLLGEVEKLRVLQIAYILARLFTRFFQEGQSGGKWRSKGCVPDTRNLRTTPPPNYGCWKFQPQTPVCPSLAPLKTFLVLHLIAYGIHFRLQGLKGAETIWMCFSFSFLSMFQYLCIIGIALRNIGIFYKQSSIRFVL